MWVFKHIPESLDEMVLDIEQKERLKEVIIKSPNILLAGVRGTGKGTFVNIFLKETGYEFIKINASMENNIDVMRSKVSDFAHVMSLSKFKIIYLNEMDYLSPAAQASLRDLMDATQEHTRFVFTCNYPHKVTDELKSRCQIIELNHPPAKDIFSLCMKILEKENIKIVDVETFKKNLVKIIKDLYPDIRSIINSLEISVVKGSINNILRSNSNEIETKIMNLILEKNLDELRSFLRANPIDYPGLYAHLFENIRKFKNPAQAILSIGEALRWDSMVAIKEINFLTMIVDMMTKGVV